MQSGQATTADISMVPAGTITGRGLTSTGGDGVRPGHRRLQHPDGDLAARSTTSSDFETGAYTLQTLATQDVRIQYFISDQTCWYDSKRSEGNTNPVHVESAPRPPASISPTVPDSQSGPEPE